MSGGSSSGSGFDEWRTRDGATKPTGPKGDGDGGGADGGADRCAIYETTVLASPVGDLPDMHGHVSRQHM